MNLCFFTSDLHGRVNRYQRLFDLMVDEKPDCVFLGGDLLPSSSLLRTQSINCHHDFVINYMIAELTKVRDKMGKDYPLVFIILGNDDARIEEASIQEGETAGIWIYLHQRKFEHQHFQFYGYGFIPPTPFQLKDWEKYDISRYVEFSCLSPEEGFRTIPVDPVQIRQATIQKDLLELTLADNLDNAVFLFHSPPYHTALDRAALDGKMIDHVPLDVHVGSIAIQRFINTRQPLLTLHGHVHESMRLTGSWRINMGRTACFNGANDGPELALIRFDLNNLSEAARKLYS